MAQQQLSNTFNSPIFGITAGKGKEFNLTAHRAILEKSPIFKAMCNGPFKEGETRMIKLPEDDYYHVSCLVQYLYTGDFDLGSLDGAPELKMDHQSAQNTARIYLLGDKYEIKGLQMAAAQKLISIHEEAGRRSRGSSSRAFLRAAHLIYKSTAASDRIFRTQFRDAMFKMFMKEVPAPGDLLAESEEVVIEGGELAADIFSSQHKALNWVITKEKFPAFTRP